MRCFSLQLHYDLYCEQLIGEDHGKTRGGYAYNVYHKEVRTHYHRIPTTVNYTQQQTEICRLHSLLVDL
jgi:hypothetical protein